MQTFKLSFWFVLIVFISSCGQDDDAAQKETSPIVGTWELVEELDKLAGEDEFNPPPEPSPRIGQSWTFFQNGDLEIIPSGRHDIGEPRTTGTWELAGSDTRLILTFDDATGEYPRKILSLDDNELMTEHVPGLIALDSVRSRYKRID